MANYLTNNQNKGAVKYNYCQSFENSRYDMYIQISIRNNEIHLKLVLNRSMTFLLLTLSLSVVNATPTLGSDSIDHRKLYVPFIS